MRHDASSGTDDNISIPNFLLSESPEVSEIQAFLTALSPEDRAEVIRLLRERFPGEQPGIE